MQFFFSNCRSTIDQNIQNFWRLKSYETLPKLSSELVPPNEKRSLNILEETAFIKDNRVETGFLWKSNVPHLPANRKMTKKNIFCFLFGFAWTWWVLLLLNFMEPAFWRGGRGRGGWGGCFIALDKTVRDNTTTVFWTAAVSVVSTNVVSIFW